MYISVLNDKVVLPIMCPEGILHPFRWLTSPSLHVLATTAQQASQYAKQLFQRLANSKMEGQDYPLELILEFSRACEVSACPSLQLMIFTKDINGMKEFLACSICELCGYCDSCNDVVQADKSRCLLGFARKLGVTDSFVGGCTILIEAFLRWCFSMISQVV